MKLSYSKERWEEIPDRIREMDSTELDFTEHEERELHKMEMDRRLWYMSNFLHRFLWDGSLKSKYKDESIFTEEEEEEEPQSDLEAFVQNV